MSEQRYLPTELLVQMLSKYSTTQLAEMIVQASTMGNRTATPLANSLMQLIATVMSMVDTPQRTRFISGARDVLDAMERPDIEPRKTG